MNEKHPTDGAPPEGTAPAQGNHDGQTAGAAPDSEMPVVDVLGDLPFPVVGVGASAGGIEALSRLLESLPPDPGMAFLVVLHLDPHHESMVTSILGRSTRMPVHEATNGARVEKDHVYVIPPNATIALERGHIKVRPRESVRAPHMPIDHLFRSLAEVNLQAVGVVLSGGGTDGTLGVQEISAGEGITFAQDGSTAKHDSMPRSAINSGCVDFVLPPEGIAAELLRIAKHPTAQRASDAKPAGDDAAVVAQILSVLRQSMDVDFSQYKQTTIQRRIRRRMSLQHLEKLADYLDYLRNNAEEMHALYQDLLIRVTSFFRDPELFKALSETVLPQLLENRGHDVPLRLWVAGCASGEEVYSIAMALLEFLGDKAQQTPIKILASDINPVALEKARSGTYIENIELDVSPERLRRFFVKNDGYYQINNLIREMCIFSRHNLLRAPPFSRVDFISCRNVLIYMSLALQRRVMPIFHYALNPGGYLMLGNSETIGTFDDLFEVVDDKQKIYRKKAKIFPSMLFNVDPIRAGGEPASALRAYNGPGISTPPTLPEMHKEADRLVLQGFGPPGVVVDDDFNVLQFRGQTSRYLEHGPGLASLNLLRMARDSLIVDLRAALAEVKVKKAAIRKDNVPIRDGNSYHTINLHVVPMRALLPSGGEYFLVLFEEAKQVAAPPAATPTPEARANHGGPESATLRLQQDLDATREFLQTTIEEHESVTEELKSANEEVLSSNEELQSTNEELQSAKEELQSTNEELVTVNEEVQRHNAELARLNDDLVNLFAGVNLPIVIVNRELIIRKITPLAEKVFNVIPTDVGRSLAAIRPNLDLPNFDGIIADVIRSLHGQDIEARDKAGKWYSVRILPYVTQDNKIEGASIVALDIDPLKRSFEQAQLLAKEQVARSDADKANKAKDEFLAMLAHELRNPLAPIAYAHRLLKQPGLSEADAARLLDMAERQTRHLGALLDDLLDVSRISRGKIRLQKSVVDMTALTRRVIEAVQEPTESKGHTLEVALPPEPLWCHADPVRIEQVLVNLVNNSIKYTSAGGRIRLSLTSAGNDIVARVTDTGVGIAPDMLPRVFDLFAQAEQPVDQTRTGLGIGLTLVKRLVEMHGGKVEAFSEGLGKGSEFVVQLPSVPAPAAGTEPKPAAAPPTAAKVQVRDVLIVDDTEDSAVSLASLVRLSGHKARTAGDAVQALTEARKAPPDIVFSDIGLPVMDGYELARELRKLPGMESALLVAVTGYGREEDLRLAKQAGFNHHLVKPVDFDKLMSLL